MAKEARLKGEKWINGPYKRSMDVVLGLGTLPVTAPVGALALGLTRIIDGDEVIFRQTRYGKGGLAFEMAKITTMRTPDGSFFPKTALAATSLGRKLRPFTIDEIPQLLNIIGGTMSLVGPRAASADELERIESALERNTYDEWLHAFHSSRPGGFSTYNTAARTSDFAEQRCMVKAAMDINDFKNASLMHDLGILKRAAVTGGRLLLGRTINVSSPLGVEVVPAQAELAKTE